MFRPISWDEWSPTSIRISSRSCSTTISGARERQSHRYRFVKADGVEGCDWLKRKLLAEPVGPRERGPWVYRWVGFARSCSPRRWRQRPPAAQDKPDVTIQRVARLQGCWESVSPQRTVEEQWMSPRGRSMIGVGLYGARRSSSRGPDGGASGAGRTARLRSASLWTAVSRVPLQECRRRGGPVREPGAPIRQRVGYRRDGPDGLLAWIEGTRGMDRCGGSSSGTGECRVRQACEAASGALAGR